MFDYIRLLIYRIYAIKYASLVNIILTISLDAHKTKVIPIVCGFLHFGVLKDTKIYVNNALNGM